MPNVGLLLLLLLLLVLLLAFAYVGGQKLYQLAREGQSLELPARPVTISSLRVWRSETNPQEVNFYVACSKGTYIRSLAYDMGRALGTAAHLVALRREAPYKASRQAGHGGSWEGC
ncbi:hypothetical protein VOLCADRAFT_87888 [Volvox carteri f. nagariensis]|uniref:tRNA pseudouridine(55) synthase n=1 Tax=Volvox carteri f. nagariensis TaxID=3068 RepID=D8TMI2_VOLCA|nr:uncharacterized protein VOLCADRAFT_87888 [Volvox carteri f. nagariensis]EFJ51262.1 hypothetical protein VOLCADRAFT_87888 [Volvox carteri f. nagariensis]|eukprot:XP_002947729.1 hypothetical protein VOLCADRAFT_87888 [Volvox carteri f. nagariensis]